MDAGKNLVNNDPAKKYMNTPNEMGATIILSPTEVAYIMDLTLVSSLWEWAFSLCMLDVEAR